MTIAEKLIRAKNDIDEVWNYGYNDGYDLGWYDGWEIGIEDSYQEGYDSGYGEGFVEGKSEGYDEGYSVGAADADVAYDNGLEDGIEQGKQAEREAFWNDFQDGGNRTLARGLFGGSGWNVRTFNPIHKMKPTGSSAAYMFQFCNGGSNEKIDYQKYKHLFDFSQITSAMSLFQDASIDNIEVDLSNVTSMSSAFAETYYPGRKTHITIKVSEKCTNFNAFSSCSALTHLFFTEGSVIASSIDVKSSPLTAESALSIKNALYDFGDYTENIANPKIITISKATKTALENAWDEEENMSAWDSFDNGRNIKGWALEVAQ